jgi:hypothetical protein
MGLVTGPDAVVIVKDVPAVRALTHAAMLVVLQVTLRSLPRLESMVMTMRDLAVTAVVLTTKLVTAAATATAPTTDAPQTAGDAPLVQLTNEAPSTRFPLEPSRPLPLVHGFNPPSWSTNQRSALVVDPFDVVEN